MPAVCAMRCMHQRPRRWRKPTTMPSVRSRNTVRPKVASSTTASPRELRSRVANCVLLGHVPRHRRQHAGQRGERNVRRERRGQQDEQQQEQRMHHAGDRPARAGPHVGGGARDRAGDADAAEQRRRRYWRRLAPPVRSSSDGGVPSCRRPPPPTTAIRSRPAARRRMASGSTSCTFRRETAGRGGAGSDPRECRRSACRSSRPARPAPTRCDGAQRPRSTCPASAAAHLRSADDQANRQRCAATAQRIEQCASAAPSAASFGTTGPAPSGSVRPSRSLIWLAKMMTAMPAVKPTVTG